MEKFQHECALCGKKTSPNNSNVGAHVKRIHGISCNEYIFLYYKEYGFFVPEKCGFCKNDAIPGLKIDHVKKIFTRNYLDGYLCNTDECKNDISKIILGVPYNIKSYQHIGSKSEYIKKKHKLQNINDAYKLKGLTIENIKKKYKLSSDAENQRLYLELKRVSDLRPKSCSLDHYILRYGNIEGNRKYKERCQKIGKTNTINWYIEKYGIEIGTKKWNDFREKIKKSTLGTSRSKSQLRISKQLKELNIDHDHEYQYVCLKNGKLRYVDYFLKDYNIIIEYYGDYWHCNPKIFTSDYFHKILKMTAEEIWKKDMKRIDEIKHIFNATILIIWETTFFTNEYFLNLLNSIKNKKLLIEI